MTPAGGAKTSAGSAAPPSAPAEAEATSAHCGDPWCTMAPQVCNARPLHHRDQAFYRAVLLLLILAPQHRPTQRTARCRSNKRDFQPDSMVNMYSMCAWATLCQRRAAEYRRNTCNSIDAPSAHGPPPLKFPCRNGKKKKNLRCKLVR